MIIEFVDKNSWLNRVKVKYCKNSWNEILYIYYMGKTNKKDININSIKNKIAEMSGELERRQLLAVNPYDFTYICYETDEKDNIYRGAAFTSDDENIVIFPLMRDFSQMLSIILHEVIHIEVEKSGMEIPDNISDEDYVIKVEKDVINNLMEKNLW